MLRFFSLLCVSILPLTCGTIFPATSDTGTNLDGTLEKGKIRGDHGRRGHRGRHGHRGERGHTGFIGRRGEQGPRGATGGQGPMGPTGATGPEGDPGQQGPTGPTGPIGPLPTPEQTFLLEEFVSGDTNTNRGSIGALGWTYFSSNVEESTSVAYEPSELNHPGILRLFTPESSTTYYLQVNQHYTEESTLPILTNDPFDLTFIVRPRSSAQNLTNIRIGLINEPSQESPTNGVWFEKQESGWVAFSKAGSSFSSVTLTTEFSTEEWDTFRIQRDENGVHFTITTSEGTFSANILDSIVNPNGVPLTLCVQMITGDELEEAPVDVDYMCIQFPNLDRTATP